MLQQQEAQVVLITLDQVDRAEAQEAVAQAEENLIQEVLQVLTALAVGAEAEDRLLNMLKVEMVQEEELL